MKLTPQKAYLPPRYRRQGFCSSRHNDLPLRPTGRESVTLRKMPGPSLYVVRFARARRGALHFGRLQHGLRAPCGRNGTLGEKSCFFLSDKLNPPRAFHQKSRLCKCNDIEINMLLHELYL